MVKLYNKISNEYLGEITDIDLQFLIDNLVEEHLNDIDYYINKEMLETLKEKGASQKLLEIIESAMGSDDNVEIRYEKIILN
ncbi:MAG: galactosyldiacylglycerol synthase [Candidatus Omnitrophica bacterium]|nr:galactosyldiacylglycerol synthase [Candidatus Omnitrophota bacterium]MCK5392921.1 galactosyldiacylglycerol synthase [Candidatus Omnitrophota bacterium]MCK5492664.1 galactosyldiacylglycerol synthase [Candidatus Omnitrophota bacterium]